MSTALTGPLLALTVAAVPAPPLGLPDRPQPGSAWELERRVEGCEREATRASLEVAWVKARLAAAKPRQAWELRRELEDREYGLTLAQRELASARARWALARGRRGLAVAERRKAVAYAEACAKWARDHVNRFCDPRDVIDGAGHRLIEARVDLAETEGNTPALAAALKDLVGVHEKELRRARRLEQFRAVAPDDVRTAQRQLAATRQRLHAAEQRLAPRKLPDPHPGR